MKFVKYVYICKQLTIVSKILCDREDINETVTETENHQFS